MPISGSGVIFAKGTYNWKGDWDGSNLTANYKATLNGIPVISFATNGAWPQWIPYPPLGSNGAPSPVINTAGWTNLVFIIKPANVGDQINVQGVVYQPGTTITTDIVAGSVSGVTQYASAADANGFEVVKIPLSALGLSNTALEYKVTIQENGAKAGQTWYISYIAEF